MKGSRLKSDDTSNVLHEFFIRNPRYTKAIALYLTQFEKNIEIFFYKY